MERQLLADSAAWERRVPTTDTFNARLRQRLTEAHMREQEPEPLPSWLAESAERTSDGESGPLPLPRLRPPSRTRTLLAVAAAVVIVGLLAAVFADLTRGRTGQRPGASGTATVTESGTATATAAATQRATPTTYTMLVPQPAVIQQPGTPVVAPSNPNVIYEYADNGTGVVLRRSDDGGQTWHDLSYPSGGAFVGAIEVAVSSLDANNVFLRLDLGYQPGTSNPCQAIAQTQHGGVLASGGLDCRVEFSSRDGGAHWTRIALPVSGELFQSGVTFSYDPTTIQAGGDRLYGRVWQLDANGVQTGDIRIASTRDEGKSWQDADASLARAAGHICAFSAAPGSATVFAVGSTTTCWANPAGERSVWRSDDAGAHWVRAGGLPVALTQPGASFIAASEGGAAGASAVLFGIPGPAATAGAVEVLASGDGGRTWHAVTSRGLPAGAQVLGVGGTPLPDGSIVVMVAATPVSSRQPTATAGPTATPAEPGSGSGQQSAAMGYVWQAGDSSWRQVIPAATINGPGISNIFVSNGSRLVVTLSIANDMTSNPTYTLERFEQGG